MKIKTTASEALRVFAIFFVIALTGWAFYLFICSHKEVQDNYYKEARIKKSGEIGFITGGDTWRRGHTYKLRLYSKEYDKYYVEVFHESELIILEKEEYNAAKNASNKAIKRAEGGELQLTTPVHIPGRNKAPGSAAREKQDAVPNGNGAGG